MYNFIRETGTACRSPASLFMFSTGKDDQPRPSIVVTAWAPAELTLHNIPNGSRWFPKHFPANRRHNQIRQLHTSDVEVLIPQHEIDDARIDVPRSRITKTFPLDPLPCLVQFLVQIRPPSFGVD